MAPQQISSKVFDELSQKERHKLFLLLDAHQQMTVLVRETKRRLTKLGCGHLSVRRGKNSMCWRLSVNRRDLQSIIAPWEMKVVAEVLGGDASQKTNRVSMSMEEAAMVLGFRPRQPLCSWCGTLFKRERDALSCLNSH